VIELAPELVSDLRREAIRRHVSVSSLAVRLLDTAVRDGLVDAILDDDVPEPV